MRATGQHPLCGLPALELARLVRGREVSPVEVLDAHLERIEGLDPTLNAYVTVLGDEARRRALDAERAILVGAELGPLHGVPVAIKDLFDFKAGAPHSFGFLDPQRWSPTVTALPVERLERAGAIVIGKTASPALGHKLTTDGPACGPTSTPFAPGYNAGGSSGGAAAAVAACMATVAIGSDAAGSLRVPASLCGVFSLKPTYGRVASAWRPNAFRSLTPMGQVGPIARTVADAACVLDVIAGPHRADPMSLPWGGEGNLITGQMAVDSLRVAYSPDLGTFPVAPEVTAAVETGLRALKAAGVAIDRVELKLPDHEELCGIVRRLVGLGLLDAVVALGQEGLSPHDGEAPPDEGLLELIEQASALRVVDLKADEARRTDLLDALEDVFESHDAIVTPVACVAAVRNSGDGRTVGPDEVAGRPVDPLLGWSLAYPLNLTGHPAASVPAGFSDGFPIGMQVIGRRFEEATVIALAAAVERSPACRVPYASIGVKTTFSA
jgi:Asp-tRNA(Asn)/Glu-tRNA(Gln) amidotransferase A subunit family amidase